MFDYILHSITSSYKIFSWTLRRKVRQVLDNPQVVKAIKHMEEKTKSKFTSTIPAFSIIIVTIDTFYFT